MILRLCFFGVVVASLASGDVQKCSGALLNQKAAFEVHYNPVPKMPAALADAVPDYDPSQDVLFTFINHHTSLYFGRYFWDWDSAKYQVRENPKAIAANVAVRVRVGKTYVQKLENATESGEHKKYIWGTCELRSIFFLQQQGIFVNGRVPMTGLTLFETVLSKGFVDKRGKRFPQAIEAIQRPGQDPIQTTAKYLPEHHVRYFYMFLGAYGVSRSQFAAHLERFTPDLELLQISELLSNDTTAQTLNARQKKFVINVIRATERRFLNGVECFFENTYQALETAILKGYHGRPEVSSGAAQALKDAIQEVVEGE